MPNLVGVWRDGASRQIIESILDRQLRAVDARAVRYTDYRYTTDGFGAALKDHGLFANGPQPARSADGRFTLWLDGEILNDAALVRRHRAHLPDGPLSPPQLCLELIRRFGPGIARELNGLFAIVLYDSVSRSLTLISDRYGFRPLFYRESAGILAFGTELKAVRAADDSPLRLDEAAVAELFCFGSHLYGSTWWEGCMRLTPATILVHDAGGTRTTRYWRYRYDESARALDQPTYVTRFAVLLDRAVERCMRGPSRIGMFLSGGYDSRSVAAAIRPEHLPIPAFTFGVRDSRDARYAPMLARRLGLEHTHLDAEPGYLTAHCHGIVWRTEGMLPFSRTTSMQFHTRLKERMDIVLTGFLGEFSGSHTWPALLALPRGRRLEETILERMLGTRPQLVRRVLRADVFERGMQAIRERFRASLEQIENEHPLNVADVWNIVHMQPQVTYQSPAVDRYLFEVRAPHMDAELVDFLLTIPPLSRIEQRIYKQVIAYAFPAIRDVPCTNSGVPIDPHFAREYVKIASRFAGRKLRSAFDAVVGRPAPLGRNIRNLGDDFRAEPQLVDRILLPLVDEGYLPRELFDAEGIRTLAAEHYAGRVSAEETLAQLISLGLALKLIGAQDTRDVPETLR